MSIRKFYIDCLEKQGDSCRGNENAQSQLGVAELSMNSLKKLTNQDLCSTQHKSLFNVFTYLQVSKK